MIVNDVYPGDWKSLLHDISHAIADGWKDLGQLPHFALACRDNDLLRAMLATRYVPCSDKLVSHPNGWSPLHHAVMDDNLDAIHLLLEFGASVKVEDYEGYPAPYYALQKCNIAALRLFLNDRRHDCFRLRCGHGNTLAHAAVIVNRSATSEYGEMPHTLRIVLANVISAVVDLTAYNEEGQTALILSLIHDDVALAQEFVLHCPRSVSLPHRISGHTPLHLSVLRNDYDLVQFFLNQGAQVNRMDYNNRTPLHYAVQGQFMDVAKLLIQYGACIDLCDESGCTPLLLATRTGDTSIVSTVLEYPATLTDPTTSLHLASSFALSDTVRATIHKMSYTTREVSIPFPSNTEDLAQAYKAYVRHLDRGECDQALQVLAYIESKVNAPSLIAHTLLAMCSVCDASVAIHYAFRAMSLDPWNPRTYDVSSQLLASLGCDALQAEVIAIRDHLLHNHGHHHHVALSPFRALSPPLNDLEIGGTLDPTMHLPPPVAMENGSFMISVYMPGGAAMWVYITENTYRYLMEGDPWRSRGFHGFGVLKGPIASGYPIPSGSLIAFRNRKFIEVVESDIVTTNIPNYTTFRRVKGFPVSPVVILPSGLPIPFTNSNSNRHEISALLAEWKGGEDMWITAESESALGGGDGGVVIGKVFYPLQNQLRETNKSHFSEEEEEETIQVRLDEWDGATVGQSVLVDDVTGRFLYAIV
eukprot:PhF_6_TR37635/c0_g1_i1/m.55991